MPCLDSIQINNCYLQLIRGGSKIYEFDLKNTTANQLGTEVVVKDLLSQFTFTSSLLTSLGYTIPTFIAYIEAQRTACITGTVVTSYATDTPDLNLTVGTYTKVQVMAKLATDGYTGGKTHLYQIQFISVTDSFELSKLGMTTVVYPQGSNAIHSGQSLGEEADDFTIKVNGLTIAKLIIY